ncbi:MAG TPA: matrixin family metalloprotease [Thermoanaerobaculia bacterium]|nr:matrixin family metalloprotease [Thermoanaerobaculia bacterium]
MTRSPDLRHAILRRAALAAAAVAVVVLAVPAHAYLMIYNPYPGRTSSGYAVPCNYPGGFVHWNTRNIPWYLNTAGKGAGKSPAISNAARSWAAVSGANHNPYYANTTGAGFSTDGRNTILWGSGGGCSGSCLAVTALVLSSGQVITEADILFNSAHNWSTDGTQYDTEAVAAHEIGHALGIHHSDVSSSATMYAYYFGSAGRTLHSDDWAALQCAESRY